MAKVAIFTGGFQSGKTTAIIELSKRRTLFGFASPVRNGKRFLINLETGEERALEFNEASTSKEKLSVGRFVFNPQTFDWARGALLKLTRESKSPVIIDEYGPLELRGEGFEPFLNDGSILTLNLQFVIVVREKLIEKFVEKFKINNPQIIYDLNELR